MSAIVAVTNGVTVEDQSHFNQYKDTFSNVFGITDTAQSALGRLVIPVSTSNPSTPAAGQSWLRSDLGVDGRLFYRHNASVVAHLPYRQVVRATTVSGTLASPLVITSTSFTDITNATVSITTTGGELECRFIPEASATEESKISFSQALFNTTPRLWVALLVDGTIVAQVTFFWSTLNSGGTTTLVHNTIPLSAFNFGGNIKPSAAAHTVKLQAKVVSGDTFAIQAARFEVKELGD